MNLKYDTSNTMEVEWLGNTITMVSLHKRGQVASHVDTYLSQLEADELGWDLDNYLDVIKKPMDLSTIKQN